MLTMTTLEAPTIPFHIACLIAETYPLRGRAATEALARAAANLGNTAELDGLTEQGVDQIINEALLARLVTARVS